MGQKAGDCKIGPLIKQRFSNTVIQVEKFSCHQELMTDLSLRKAYDTE